MADEVKRMRYFDGLFLKQEEFNLEQDYHIRMRHLKNRLLYRWGVVSGLEVSSGPGAREVTVTKGVALNRVTDNGEEISQEIVLTNDTIVDLSSIGAGDSVYLHISYSEEKVDIVTEKGNEEIHWRERPLIGISASQPADTQEYIVLAKVVINPDGTVDNAGILYEEAGDPVRPVRTIASLIAEGGLHVGGTTDPGNKSLLVDGNCTINGDLVVQGETTTVNTQNLEVEDNIIRVNKYDEQSSPREINGGFEVFRGGTAKNAQIVWDEADDKWKIGLEGSLTEIGHVSHHNTTHQKDGSDEIDVTSLSGVLSDAQRVSVQYNGNPVVTHSQLNFEGEGVSVNEDAANNCVNINISGGKGAEAARGGSVIITTRNGVGSARVKSGFDHANFCVNVGVEHEGYVEYGNVQYEGRVLQYTVRVHQGTNLGTFEIMINTPGLGNASVPMQWWAVPGLRLFSPTVTRPTVTRPTVTRPTVTRPTVTRPTVTRPTVTGPTVTRPTVTRPTVTRPTVTGPTIISPTSVPPARIVPLTEVRDVGDETARRLNEAGIHSANDLASASPEFVAEVLGMRSVDKARVMIEDAGRRIR